MTKSQLKSYMVGYQLSMIDNDKRTVEEYERLIMHVYRFLDGKSVPDIFADEKNIKNFLS